MQVALARRPANHRSPLLENRLRRATPLHWRPARRFSRQAPVSGPRQNLPLHAIERSDDLPVRSRRGSAPPSEKIRRTDHSVVFKLSRPRCGSKPGQNISKSLSRETSLERCMTRYAISARAFLVCGHCKVSPEEVNTNSPSVLNVTEAMANSTAQHRAKATQEPNWHAYFQTGANTGAPFASSGVM